MSPPTHSPSPLRLSFAALRRRISDLGLGERRPRRAVERYPAPLDSVISRAVSLLEGPCLDQGVRLAFDRSALPTLIIDPWRLELALLAPTLAALPSIETGGLVRIWAQVDSARIALHWEALSHGFAERLSTRLDGGLAALEEPRDELVLAVQTALRVASDHGGELEIAWRGGDRSRLSLLLGRDPESFGKNRTEPKRTGVYLSERHRPPRRPSEPRGPLGPGTWLA